ncbi:MAG: YwmB family TATA-box binding protein [Thermoflexaceae bacterium]|nr:YwmB family TATA-box binding protein [Thermoflexaceae bacterium]
MPVYSDEIRKKSWNRTIRKVILAVVLWVVAITRIIMYGSSGSAKETLVSAFNQIQLNEMSASIEAFGYYSDVYLSEKAKETFVKDIGYELGLNYCDIYTDREGDIATTGLIKNGKYADTEIKLITREEKISENVLESHQYLLITIDLGSNLDAAVDYQKVLKELFAEMEIDGDVTVNLTGYQEGRADLALKSMITDQLIEQMDASIVAQNRTEELFTVYAYTDKVDDFIKVSGKKINLNISAYYDENDDRTYFYVATPIINTDY